MEYDGRRGRSSAQTLLLFLVKPTEQLDTCWSFDTVQGVLEVTSFVTRDKCLAVRETIEETIAAFLSTYESVLPSAQENFARGSKRRGRRKLFIPDNFHAYLVTLAPRLVS